MSSVSLFDIPSKIDQIKQINDLMLNDNFWDDKKKAQKLIFESNNLSSIITKHNKILTDCKNILDEIVLANQEYSEELHQSIDDEFSILLKELNQFEIQILLNDSNDNLNAIVEIHPGAGGTESQDWAEMLYTMYIKYAEINDFKIETLDYEQASDAGIKSVSFVVKGTNAYGYLKSERGVHRLVRISPFDASGRRHTSFASVDVIPEITDTEVIINEADLKIDTYRASGAGGQHINKTDSAVRITHLPTGIVVTCQNQRSQIQNKEKCMQTLAAKLQQKELEEQQKNLDSIRGEQKLIEWGSQIRSYVFCPYTLVKDHRTDYEENDVESVMNGYIDNFIFAYLKKRL